MTATSLFDICYFFNSLVAPLKGSDHPAGIIEGEFIVIFKKEMKDNDSK